MLPVMMNLIIGAAHEDNHALARTERDRRIADCGASEGLPGGPIRVEGFHAFQISCAQRVTLPNSLPAMRNDCRQPTPVRLPPAKGSTTIMHDRAIVVSSDIVAIGDVLVEIVFFT